MARRAIPKDTRAKLLSLLRDSPGAISNAAAGRALGVGFRVVKKLRQSVDGEIATEQAATRARMADRLAVEEKERGQRLLEAERLKAQTPELAALDAIEARVRQGTAARGLLDLVEDARKVGERVVRHGGRLAEVLEARGVDGMSATEALVALTRSATYLQSLGESVERAIKLERLVFGESTENVSFTNAPDLAELHAEHEAFTRELQLLKGKDDALATSDDTDPQLH